MTSFRLPRKRPALVIVALTVAGAAVCSLVYSQQQPPGATPASRLTAVVDAHAAGRPFPHFWEQMFGSGRAILSLRESYRRDLAAVRSITEFQYVRFHGIFNDEVGVYTEDAQGRPEYNFSYVDQIYDGLIAAGARPFVELGFMPRALAASQTPHAFWYKPLPNPPVSYDKWGELIYRFTRHVVDRYGIDEVSNWYFEVWNEPNIDFWTGAPKQSTYFQLYDAAAKAIKRVNERLRVGGPATAQAAWVDAMIAHAVEAQVPLDFVSTHVYANDKAEDVFGTHDQIPRSDMVGRAVKKVFDQVHQSQRPQLPIIWSEYNASYMNEVEVTDSAFMGPWLANNIRLCDGLQNMMSYWTFSDVFEEQGVPKTPFYGGFGLIAKDHIPKAAFNAFSLLHRLGEERISAGNAAWVLATKRRDGALVIAAWNYAAPGESGPPADASITLTNADSLHHLSIQTVAPGHGSTLEAWKSSGQPAFPTRQQVRQLQAAAQLAPADMRTLTAPTTTLNLTLAPHELALIELTP